MTPHPLHDLLIKAYYATDNRMRAPACRWVMNRAWYDRIRAEAVTDEQERERAAAHSGSCSGPAAGPPYQCPACPSGPFADMRALAGHVAAMADPLNREPAAGDQLLGIPVEVRENGGEPHLEHAGYLTAGGARTGGPISAAAVPAVTAARDSPGRGT